MKVLGYIDDLMNMIIEININPILKLLIAVAFCYFIMYLWIKFRRGSSHKS